MTQDVIPLIDLLTHANQLKRTVRTGWAQRGIPQAENVAAHTYGVAFTAMTLAPHIPDPTDTADLLIMALLHDLPEALTTDIPAPAWRYMPAGSKHGVERSALTAILPPNNATAERWHTLWEALHTNDTAEARLVHDADKVEMYLQALIYQQQHGNAHLDEFWAVPHTFHYDLSQRIYNHLCRVREETV